MSNKIFIQLCGQFGIPTPVEEFRFSKDRKWRFDFAWPEHKVALEVEGGVFVKGRHTRPIGFIKDMEKYSEAASLGWLIIRCQPKEILSKRVFDWILKSVSLRNGNKM